MMDKTYIYLYCLVIFCSLHIVATTIIFLRLKAQLKKSDLDSFKRILGVHYHRKQQLNGKTKYKWYVGLMIVRGSFDDDEQLVECEIKPYTFFPIAYKESFL